VTRRVARATGGSGWSTARADGRHSRRRGDAARVPRSLHCMHVDTPMALRGGATGALSLVGVRLLPQHLPCRRTHICDWLHPRLIDGAHSSAQRGAPEAAARPRQRVARDCDTAAPRACMALVRPARAAREQLYTPRRAMLLTVCVCWRRLPHSNTQEQSLRLPSIARQEMQSQEHTHKCLPSTSVRPPPSHTKTHTHTQRSVTPRQTQQRCWRVQRGVRRYYRLVGTHPARGCRAHCTIRQNHA
jgi:hypothetical protein